MFKSSHRACVVMCKALRLPEHSVCLWGSLTATLTLFTVSSADLWSHWAEHELIISPRPTEWAFNCRDSCLTTTTETKASIQTDWSILWPPPPQHQHQQRRSVCVCVWAALCPHRDPAGSSRGNEFFIYYLPKKMSCFLKQGEMKLQRQAIGGVCGCGFAV